MKLTEKEKEMLEGRQGKAVKKSMEILTALGEIFGAQNLVDVASVQVSGVSYHNLGEEGLEFLSEMAQDGRARVLTTLNPAGMDLENWRTLGISKDFAEKQEKVINAFKKMGIITSCTCTPYLIGNVPLFNEHLAWGESSAVCFANSVLGARTNKEGGPSALASALTGKTPNYGLHLSENRQANITVNVSAELSSVSDFGALGYAIGKKVSERIPLIKGIKKASLEELKSFCASIATYANVSLFHMEGITPNKTIVPKEEIEITSEDIFKAYSALNDLEKPDFVSIGCPHCSIKELEKIAKLLEGKKVKIELWIATSRQTKKIAEQSGISKIIESSGAKFACDTCMAVAPLKGRFFCLATDSAKACYYGRGSNNFKTRFGTTEQCINYAITGEWK